MFSLSRNERPQFLLQAPQLTLHQVDQERDPLQVAATAQRLQAEHLAYMDGLANEGKLVLAGPINEIRSMITGRYRVPQARAPHSAEKPAP